MLCRRSRGGAAFSDLVGQAFLGPHGELREVFPSIRGYRAMATDSHPRKDGSGCVRIRRHTQSFGDEGDVTVSYGSGVGHLGEGELESGQITLGSSNRMGL